MLMMTVRLNIFGYRIIPKDKGYSKDNSMHFEHTIPIFCFLKRWVLKFSYIPFLSAATPSLAFFDGKFTI